MNEVKKELVITGTMVARAVQVLVCLCLVWVLVQDMLGWQSLDDGVITLLICELAGLEVSLQADKKESGTAADKP